MAEQGGKGSSTLGWRRHEAGGTLFWAGTCDPGQRRAALLCFPTSLCLQCVLAGLFLRTTWDREFKTVGELSVCPHLEGAVTVKSQLSAGWKNTGSKVHCEECEIWEPVARTWMLGGCEFWSPIYRLWMPLGASFHFWTLPLIWKVVVILTLF